MESNKTKSEHLSLTSSKSPATSPKRNNNFKSNLKLKKKPSSLRAKFELTSQPLRQLASSFFNSSSSSSHKIKQNLSNLPREEIKINDFNILGSSCNSSNNNNHNINNHNLVQTNNNNNIESIHHSCTISYPTTTSNSKLLLLSSQNFNSTNESNKLLLLSSEKINYKLSSSKSNLELIDNNNNNNNNNNNITSNNNSNNRNSLDSSLNLSANKLLNKPKANSLKTTKLSTLLHYPSLASNSTNIAKCFSNKFDEMTSSANPNDSTSSDIVDLRNENSRLVESIQQTKQPTSFDNNLNSKQRLNDSLILNPSSSSASSSSSPPTYVQSQQTTSQQQSLQPDKQTTSTPSSKQSISPLSTSNISSSPPPNETILATNNLIKNDIINNNSTPTHVPLLINRFIIKKLSDSELNNDRVTETSVQPIINTNKNQPLQQQQQQQQQQEQLNKPVERKINNKFTVKKVETSDLLITNNSIANNGNNNINLNTNTNVVSNLEKLNELNENLINKDVDNSQQLNVDNKISQVLSDNLEILKAENDINNQQNNTSLQNNNNNNNINQQELQNQQILQHQQSENGSNYQQANESNTDLSRNTFRSNSVLERYDQSEDKDKDADIQEDEKPIDESPDKRFLKYEVEIGHGSFKTVYKGLDTESGVPVAWCELHDRKFSKLERQRFIEEAEMLKQLQHPNIVRFYDYWEDTKTKPKKIILVTELMTSGTLKAYVQRFKKQEKNKRLKVIKNFANQILKGLAYLHSRNVIHRDLKCDNVFVTGQCGQVKIGDLGLATLKKASFAKSVIGTPEFMAPEMYSEQYDESIDVYAFGMCLLEMATGEYPYQECTKPFEIYKRVTQGVKPENYYRVDNDDLKELIFRCIRLKTSQRPTVRELVNHSWFMENNGLKLEINKDEQTKKIVHENETQVKFRLKVVDKSRRKVSWPDNEEIEFNFDCDRDDPELIVKELKDNIDKINDDDLKYLIQSIKDKILVSKYEREDALENASTTISNTSNSTNNNNNITSTNQQTAQDNSTTKTEQQQQQLNTNELSQPSNQNDSNLKLNQSVANNENNTINEINESQQNNNMILNQENKTKHQVHFKEEDSIILSDQSKQQNTKLMNDTILKFCVLEVSESVISANDNNNGNNIVDTLVSYQFQVDDSEMIRYKFRLNVDTPQDIASLLINNSPNNKSFLNENIMFLIELIQNVLQFINTNRLNNNNQNNQNKQFTYIINKSNLNSSKLKVNDESINLETNNLIQQQQQQKIAQQQPHQQQQNQQQTINQTYQNNQIQQSQFLNNKSNYSQNMLINEHQQQQQQQQQHQQQQPMIYHHTTQSSSSSSSTNTPVNHYHHHHYHQNHPNSTSIQNHPSYQLISNEILKNLQIKQAQINAELIQVQNAIDTNNFKLNHHQILPNQSLSNQNSFHMSLNEYDQTRNIANNPKPILIRQNQIYTTSPPQQFNKINIQQQFQSGGAPQSAPILHPATTTSTSSNQSSRITSPTHMMNKHQNEFFPVDLQQHNLIDSNNQFNDSLNQNNIKSYASVVTKINKNQQVAPNLSQLKKNSIDYTNLSLLNETSIDNQSGDLSLISSNLDESKHNLILQQQQQLQQLQNQQQQQQHIQNQQQLSSSFSTNTNNASNKPTNDLKELDLKLGSLLKSDTKSNIISEQPLNESVTNYQMNNTINSELPAISNDINKISNHLNDSSATFSSPSNPISRRNSVDLLLTNKKQSTQMIPSNLSNIHNSNIYTSFNLMNQSGNVIDQIDHDKLINQQVTSYPSLTNSSNPIPANIMLLNNINNNTSSPSTTNIMNHNQNTNDLQFSSLPLSCYSSNNYGANTNITVNNTNHEFFTKLFLKHRRESEELIKRQQLEIQEYLAYFHKQQQQQEQQQNKKKE